MTKEERAAYMREYAIKNREQINANARRRYNKNIEKFRLKQHEAYLRRKECKRNV